MRVRLHDKLKPNSYTESFEVNGAGRWRERTCEYPGRSRKQSLGKYSEDWCSNNELREVSRGHSTMEKKWEGPNNRKSDERMKGGPSDESRIS